MDTETKDKSIKFEEKTKNKESVNKNAAKPTEDKPKHNYFKLTDDDVATMQDLEVKLNEIHQTYKEEEVDIHEKFNSPTEDILEAAEKEGKYWKHDQLRIRLEKIQSNLNEMAIKEDEDQKKLKEIYENTDDLDN